MAAVAAEPRAIDYDNPEFNQGVQHVVDLLAKTLGAEGWVAGDGSEDYDCDLEQTLLNILAAKGLYNSDDGQYLCRAEYDAAIEVSETARRYVAALETKLLGHERELADLIAAYYRREIGTLMHQAEHWANENHPLAVHHRVLKADSYYQIVALCERFGENPFHAMRRALAREPIYPPGSYPPTPEINEYRDPKYVVDKLNTAPKATGGDA